MTRDAIGKPDPVDVYVGQQIKAQRLRLGLNQSDLGRAIGVTFQQVQKYEKGTNRVSASMLARCATILNCHPANFFPTDSASVDASNALASAPGGARLEALYLRMSPKARKAMLNVAEILADPEASP